MYMCGCVGVYLCLCEHLVCISSVLKVQSQNCFKWNVKWSSCSCALFILIGVSAWVMKISPLCDKVYFNELNK